MSNAQKLVDSIEIDASAGKLRTNPYKAIPPTKRTPKSSPQASSPTQKRTRANTTSTPADVPSTKRTGHVKTKSVANPKDANPTNSPDLVTPPLEDDQKTPSVALFQSNTSEVPPSSAFTLHKSDQKRPNLSTFDDVFGKSPITPGQSPSGIKNEDVTDFLDPRHYQAGDFGYLETGEEKHKEWTPLAIHTAKCDGCGKQNKSVLQRCGRCNKQLCKECIFNTTGEAMEGHEVNSSTLVWDPPKAKRTPKLMPKAKRPIAARRGNQFEDAPYDDKPRRVQRKPKLESKETGQATQPRKKQRTSDDTISVSDDSYEDRGLGDEELSRKHDDYRREKDWDQEDEMNYDYMSNEHLGNLYHKDHQQFPNGNKRSAGHGWGSTRPWPKNVSTASTPKNDIRLGPVVENVKGIQGESLDELFTTAARASDDKAEKDRLEQKLQYDILRVRQTNPDYKRLVEQGRKDEAETMIDGAAALIRIRQGL